MVRKLCPNCKKEETITDPEHVELIPQPVYYKAVGCQSCHFTGYKGRVGIYELISISNEIKQLLKENPNQLSYEYLPKSHQNLKHKAIQLIAEGLTAIEEVYPIIIEN